MKDLKFYDMLLKETKNNIKDQASLVEVHAALVSVLVKTMVMTFELNPDYEKTEKALKEYIDKHMECFYKSAQDMWKLRMIYLEEPGTSGADGNIPRWMLG